MSPSIAQIVMFVEYNGVHEPAIITSIVSDSVVNLFVFIDPMDHDNAGGFLQSGITYSSDINAPYTWHYMSDGI
jgi:hypothetical protein